MREVARKRLKLLAREPRGWDQALYLQPLIGEETTPRSTAELVNSWSYREDNLETIGSPSQVVEARE